MTFISARGLSIVDSEEVEIMAWGKALEFAIDAGFTELSIGSHSVQYTMLASGTWMVHSSANFVAHSLAKYARYVDDELIWLEDSPSLVMEAL